MSGVLDGVQTGLDVLGMIPAFGEISDGINALIYLARGDYLNAGLSAGAMIPFAGWFALAAAPLVKAGKKVPDGSFSVWDWTGYPAGFPKPEGPFRLITGGEYNDARRAADNANRRIHRQNPALSLKQIHEIHPVKFGGHPTDISNKIPLEPETHRGFNRFWRKSRRNAEGH